MTTDELLENGLIESLGRVVAVVQQEFRSESRVITAELRADIAQMKSDFGTFLHSVEKRVGDILANVKDGKPGSPGKDGGLGPAGPEGPPGPIGPEGIAGRDGLPGEKGKDADNVEIANRLVPEVDRAVAALPKAKDGEPGQPGPPGPPGPEGPPGPPGEPGTPGEKGMDGLPGRDGKDGIGFNEDDTVLRAISLVPDDIAEKTARAINLIAESSPIVPRSEASSIVLNIDAGPKSSYERPKISKTITTRRDENNNLVAEVVETMQGAE